MLHRRNTGRSCSSSTSITGKLAGDYGQFLILEMVSCLRSDSQIAQQWGKLKQHLAPSLTRSRITASFDHQGIMQGFEGLEILEPEASCSESPQNEGEETKLAGKSRSPTSFEREDGMSNDLPLKLYRETAFTSRAFGWLVYRVNRFIRYHSSAGVLDEISSTISAQLVRANPFSRRMAPRPSEAKFVVPFDLRDFLLWQVTDGNPFDALPRVITITGAGVDAQAMTCEQYLTTMWPMTGYQMMRHLEACLQSGLVTRSGRYRFCNVPSSTNFVVQTHWPITRLFKRPYLGVQL